MADDYHFLQLTLENIRAFGQEQLLDFRNEDGRASRWCVILGSNGVGKTTVMQALAVMKPVPAFQRDENGQVMGVAGQKDGGEAGVPDWIEPDLIEYQNDQIRRFARSMPGRVVATMSATLEQADGRRIEVGFRSNTLEEELLSADPIPQNVTLDDKGPIVIAYGAARHSGDRNMSGIGGTKPTASLFNEHIELVDPEEVFEFLFLAKLAAESEGRGSDAAHADALLSALRGAIADVIPDGDAEDITIRGPRLTKNPSERTILHFRTPSGLIPYPDMSLGYRTTISWIVDLGYRLSLIRPESDRPLEESAVVLIDEVDLHLHPKWQRELSTHLNRHFPRVQFIVTTHSPIIAQEAIARGQPVAVVHWKESEATILNDPLPQSPIGYDEVVSSEAFDLETALDFQSEAGLRRRRELLLRREELDENERRELATLERLAVEVQEKDAPYDAAFERLMARVVELEKRLGPDA